MPNTKQKKYMKIEINNLLSYSILCIDSPGGPGGPGRPIPGLPGEPFSPFIPMPFLPGRP